MRFKHGRKLVGDRTAKSSLNVVKATESQFADDTATYATSHETFENSATDSGVARGGAQGAGAPPSDLDTRLM